MGDLNNFAQPLPFRQTVQIVQVGQLSERTKTEMGKVLLERRSLGQSWARAAFEVGVGADMARRLVKRLEAR